MYSVNIFITYILISILLLVFHLFYILYIVILYGSYVFLICGYLSGKINQIKIRQYWQFKDDITTECDMLFKMQKVIIPSKMRKLMLDKLHQSHQGVEKTKRLARDVLYWPGMNAEIAETVGKMWDLQHT